MCQEAVERAIGKLATDESFRTAFVADPQRASLEAGLRLSAPEIAALARIPARALERFAERLDDSICRLPCGPAAVEGNDEHQCRRLEDDVADGLAGVRGDCRPGARRAGAGGVTPGD